MNAAFKDTVGKFVFFLYSEKLLWYLRFRSKFMNEQPSETGLADSLSSSEFHACFRYLNLNFSTP